MTTILRIDSGADHPGSVTRQLADVLVATSPARMTRWSDGPPRKDSPW